MEKYKLSDMKKGWFVGDFEPTIFKTKDCEVGVKSYDAGARERAHYHVKAEELTVIISGKVKMNNNVFSSGDIIKVLRNEIIEFEALEDSTTVVFKSKSVPNDKFFDTDY